MITTFLRIFKPTYALTALLILGVFQGAVSIRRIPALDALLGREAAEETETMEPTEEEGGVLAQVIRSYHPAQRLLAWGVCYILICLALVPFIQTVLESESNKMNGLMILGFTLFGGFLAWVLMAFRWSWGRGILMVMALAASCCLFVGLAGQLEKMRVRK